MCYIMRPPLFRFILFFTIISTGTYGQSFTANLCDSTRLTRQEFEKCLADTTWNADMVIKTNYITELKTDLLPKYRTIRKELTLSRELLNSLRLLKLTYDTVLKSKLSTILFEINKNQKYVQPKAYISSLLSLQTFRFYPDVYAILLNEIHLQLSPKASMDELNNYNRLVDKISKTIPIDLYQRLEVITTSFASDNDKLMKDGFSPLFQGTQSQTDIKKYRIINFLLWTD